MPYKNTKACFKYIHVKDLAKGCFVFVFSFKA